MYARVRIYVHTFSSYISDKIAGFFTTMYNAAINTTTMNISNLSSSSNASQISPCLKARKTDITIFLLWMISMSLIGIIGNSVILAFHPNNVCQRFRTSTFVLVLAILDLVASVIVVPYSILFELNLVTNDILCRICEFIRHLTISASLFLFLSIAIQRFVAITIESNKLKKKHLFVLISLAFVAGVITSFPAIFVYKVSDLNIERVTLVEPQTSCHPLIYLYVTKILVYIIFILFIVITLSLIILYTIIYITVLRYLCQCRSVMPIEMSARNQNRFNCAELRLSPNPRQNKQRKNELNNPTKPKKKRTNKTGTMRDNLQQEDNTEQQTFKDLRNGEYLLEIGFNLPSENRKKSSKFH